MVAAPPARAGVTVFPVPTSNAGLGRITTGPDGTMWFVEKDAKRFGRITPSARITEWPLYAENEYADAESIDVAADGTVWVVYNGGNYAAAVTFDAAGSPAFLVYDFDGRYGGEVRADPAGRAWVTMNYDESGVAVLDPTQWSWPANAPECEDILGEASDGTMWCGRQGRAFPLSPGANGGATYPLGMPSAEWARSLAAGPTGSIWFTSAVEAGMFNSATDGAVGYLDQATGAVTAWHTGSKTAPSSLVAGPDGNMWFTVYQSVATGIGHISPTGVGAITELNGYEPVSLTFGGDGAVWFTDATKNSIVRVTTDQLQTTNVDLGRGVTMLLGAPAGPGGAGGGGGSGGGPRAGVSPKPSWCERPHGVP